MKSDICRWEKNYDLACCNYIKILEYRERYSSRTELLLVLRSLLIADVKHKTGNYLQRDHHVGRALTFSVTADNVSQSVLSF